MPQDRLQADAAGGDQAYSALVVLTVPAQPAQELVDGPLPLRRDAVVVVLQHPVDEDRQLVDRQHDRPIALGQSGEDLVAFLPPASSVDSRPQLHAHLGDGHRLDPLADVGEQGLDSGPRALRRLRLKRDLRDGVRRGAGVFQIDEHRLEVAVGRQVAQQLPHQTRLAHPPLRGQQRVGPVAHPVREQVELGLPVEEALSLDPVRPCLFQPRHGWFPNNAAAIDFVANDFDGKADGKSSRAARLSSGPCQGWIPAGTPMRAAATPSRFRRCPARARGCWRAGGGVRCGRPPPGVRPASG